MTLLTKFQDKSKIPTTTQGKKRFIKKARKIVRDKTVPKIKKMLKRIKDISGDLLDTDSEPCTPVEMTPLTLAIYRGTILVNHPASIGTYNLVSNVLKELEEELAEQERRKEAMNAPTRSITPNSVQSGPPTRQVTPAVDMAAPAV